MSGRASVAIGKLRRRIVIEEETSQIQDSEGSPSGTFTAFATVWARIEYGTGREFFQADQITEDQKASITIRYRPGVTQLMRVKHTPKDDVDQFFRIEGIKNLKEHNRFLVLQCVRVEVDHT